MRPLLRALMKSVGWTTIEISLPTALSRSLISWSLKNKLRCLALISVIVQLQTDEDTDDAALQAIGEGVSVDKPASSANPPRSICLISAVLPSRIMPRDSPSRLRLIINGFPCGILWTSRVIVSVSVRQCLIIFCADEELVAGRPLTLIIRSPMWKALCRFGWSRCFQPAIQTFEDKNV